MDGNITSSSDGTAIYAYCTNTYQESAEDLLVCLTDSILKTNEGDAAAIEANRRYTRNIALIFCSALAFFMQAGFAMVCAGAVRRKNLQNTMLKNLLDAATAAIAFYSVGYAFAFGDGNSFIGASGFFLMGVEDIGFWLYQYAFSAAATTIVAGTLAERCQMSAYFYYSILLSGFVYPVIVHAIWSPQGFLSGENDDPFLGVGVLDIAGGGVVHVTGGITALGAVWILGPRRGRFHDEKTGELLETPKEIKGHNIGLQLLGTLILWFGWYGFNSGSALLQDNVGNGDVMAVRAAANTTLAAAAGGITAMFVKYVIVLRTTEEANFDLVATMNGVLAGLVAITSSCGLVEYWAALVLGGIAGVIYLLASALLIKCRLDDAVDAIPVHLAGGIWGMIATGIFASPTQLQEAYGRADFPGVIYKGGGATLLLAQLVGLLYIVGWTAGVMIPFFLILDRKGLFRAGALAEVAGLDKKYFGSLQMGGGDDELTQDHIQQLSREIENVLLHKGGRVKK